MKRGIKDYAPCCEDALMWRDARIEELEAGLESEEPQEYMHNEVTGLHNMADLYEIERLRGALTRISQLGRVCKNFQECEHESCADSCGAVLKALAALKGDE